MYYFGLMSFIRIFIPSCFGKLHHLFLKWGVVFPTIKFIISHRFFTECMVQVRCRFFRSLGDFFRFDGWPRKDGSDAPR